jgi:ABC-type transport system involved in multi-copper enzyme maturation permease subunit
MRPLSALFVMSLRQALPVKRTIILVLIQLVPALVYFLSSQNRTDAAALESFVAIGASMLLGLAVPVVAIVLGAGALGAERRDETLSFIAMRPIPRSALAAVKTVAAIVGGTAIGLVGAVALGIVHVAQHGDAPLIGGMGLAVFVTTALYVSVLVPLGFLTDRAVLIAMVYLFIFEGGVVSALPALATISPWRIGLSIFGAVASDPPPIIDDLLGSLTPSAVTPLLAAVAVFVISVALTTVMLRQRDLA